MPVKLFKKILVLLFILVSLAYQADSKTLAKKGQYNLLNSILHSTEKTLIHGQWKYFPDTLINSRRIEEATLNLDYFHINVPSKKQDFKGSKYGTYYLNIVSDTFSNEQTIKTLTIYSSAKAYINNKLIAEIGEPSNNIKTNKPGLILKTYPFKLEKGNNHLVIHYANFHREKNGVANNIYLISPQKKRTQSVWQIIKHAIILGTILFIIFTQLNYYYIRRKSKLSLMFALASISIFLYIVFMSIYYFADIAVDFVPNFEITLKLWRLSYYATVMFFVLYISKLFEGSMPKYVWLFTIIYCSFSVLLTLFFPLHISSINFNYFMLFTLVIGIYSSGIGIINALRKVELAGLFVVGFTFFILTVVNDILHNLLIIKSVNLLDIGIFGMMLTQAQIINIKLSRSLVKNEKLSINLQYINNNLEDIVRRRTNEIEEQKAEIESQRDQVENQNKLILKHTKTITDSINYAREIQRAVLPDEKGLQEHFSDSFILFKPKDFVSGDFYWIRHLNINNEPHILFCVADCTGHGVPGALLSMLGMSLLNEITNQKQIINTADILEKLRERFKETLSNRTDYNISSDGMHITFCMVNKKTNTVHYSGAFQALYHMKNKEVKRYKGTRSIIGKYIQEKDFEEISFKLEKGDRLYLFTDGFADQISGKGEGRFMQKELISLLLKCYDMPFSQQKELLNNEFEAWRGEFEQIDDVLIMGLKA